GIHPPENKVQSLREPIRPAPLPPQLLIPLTQPGYAPPEVLVSPGTRVCKGQVLARGTPTFGLAVHASTSGTVTAIEPHPVPSASGLPERCLVLEPDGREQWLRMPVLDWRQASA